jgi:hypothetical protein
MTDSIVAQLNQDREKYFLENLDMKVELERLRAEYQSALKTQDLMADEIERLTGMCNIYQATTKTVEADNMKTLAERLQGEHWWLDVTGEEAAAEISRLLDALKDAAARYEAEGDADYMMVPIRRALEHKP